MGSGSGSSSGSGSASISAVSESGAVVAAPGGTGSDGSPRFASHSAIAVSHSSGLLAGGSRFLIKSSAMTRSSQNLATQSDELRRDDVANPLGAERLARMDRD